MLDFIFDAAAAIGGFLGLTGTVAATASGMAIIGAAIGGVVAALRGGNILKGVLIGGGIGAVVGGIGAMAMNATSTENTSPLQSSVTKGSNYGDKMMGNPVKTDTSGGMINNAGQTATSAPPPTDLGGATKLPAPPSSGMGDYTKAATIMAGGQLVGKMMEPDPRDVAKDQINNQLAAQQQLQRIQPVTNVPLRSGSISMNNSTTVNNSAQMANSAQVPSATVKPATSLSYYRPEVGNATA